ncbi:MAG: translation elongation factor Ts [Chlamydiota bacterium]
MSQKVTAEMVKELRERTGVGMGKCKEALDQAGGNMETAIDLLRKAGMASAVKKEGRETKEGLIGVGESNQAITLLELNAETDFVVQNEKFRQFLKDISQDAADSQPANVQTFSQQNFSKDPSVTIEEARSLVIQGLGENIQIKRIHNVPKKPNLSIGTYSHMGGKIVALVELEGAAGCESLARDIAMHIAAEAPEYLCPEEIPADVKAREEEIGRAQVQGKPENVIEKIVAGKLKAFYDQVCLLSQKYIKDNSLTIAALLESESKKLGKPLTLRKFIRWQVGA